MILGCSDNELSNCAPSESPQRIGYYSKLTPPSGFLASLGWLQALQNTDIGGTSHIETDWMRLHAIIDKKDTIIISEEFDLVTTNMSSYGLYNRDPWYGGDKQESMPFTLSNSIMLIKPSLHPEKVFHWWTSRATVPLGSSRVWFEARIRIIGAAQLQGGIDYWRNLDSPYLGYNVNNTEAGVSEWVCEAGEWIIVSVGRP